MGWANARKDERERAANYNKLLWSGKKTPQALDPAISLWSEPLVFDSFEVLDTIASELTVFNTWSECANFVSNTMKSRGHRGFIVYGRVGEARYAIAARGFYLGEWFDDDYLGRIWHASLELGELPLGKKSTKKATKGLTLPVCVWTPPKLR